MLSYIFRNSFRNVAALRAEEQLRFHAPGGRRAAHEIEQNDLPAVSLQHFRTLRRGVAAPFARRDRHGTLREDLLRRPPRAEVAQTVAADEVDDVAVLLFHFAEQKISIVIFSPLLFRLVDDDFRPRVRKGYAREFRARVEVQKAFAFVRRKKGGQYDGALRPESPYGALQRLDVFVVRRIERSAENYRRHG